MKTVALFLIALLAFAGNSIIARYALLEPAIDPASFIIIRILSGAITLCVLLAILRQRTEKSKRTITTKGSWWGALMLSVYAIAFSYAYVELETGFGALVLFAAVQLTMLGVYRLTIGQLSVPLIATYGGVLFAGELFTRQLVTAAALIIGGILIVSWKFKPC